MIKMEDAIQIITNSFFWAFINIFGIAVDTAMISGIKPGSNTILESAVMTINDLSRKVRVIDKYVITM